MDESLEDALRQLYLIDAIDENGAITSVGRTMAELPSEPSLSRTLMEANENGSLSQALTVAAMLSAEATLLQGLSKGKEKKQSLEFDLCDGSGLGDHIQLLQIYELWDKSDYNIDWCKENGLQVQGMMFVKEVRKQLCQMMQKIAKGSFDVGAGGRHGGGGEYEYTNLRKALCAGYANKLAERMVHHNGYRTIAFEHQLVQVHPSSVLKPDEDGTFPNFVVYHEIIATSRPFTRNICAVESSWVDPVLDKLKKLDINKLSGGLRQHVRDGTGGEVSDLQQEDVRSAGVPPLKWRIVPRAIWGCIVATQGRLSLLITLL